MAPRPGQVRAGPVGGGGWEAAYPPSLERMRLLGCWGRKPSLLPTLPLLCLPDSLWIVWASAFSTSLRVHRLDLSGTFPGNLFPSSFHL